MAFSIQNTGSSMKVFEHQSEDIKSTTHNRGVNKVIGGGRFGKVYKGEVSHSTWKRCVLLSAWIISTSKEELLKDVMMLTRYTHKNLISLMRFCDERGEKILVYEHASNGSLDHHLSSTRLMWKQHMKIRLYATRGLSYLHDHKGTQQRVDRQDIKSSNILLDDNWNANVRCRYLWVS